MRLWSVTLRSWRAPSRLLWRSIQVVLAAVLGAMLWLPTALHAQAGLSVPKREEDTFVEKEVVMPAYPEAGALRRFPTDWTSHVILVDETSLSIGEDGVVRYVLVVRSASGAESVSFEGLRCATGERRTFAYGRKAGASGAWSVARNSGWVAISDSRINRHYFEFWRDVFCEGKRIEQKRQILENLKRGGRERQGGTPSE